MNISKAGAWCASLLCGLASICAAADGSGLTLAESIDNALARNPELRASAFRLQRAQAAIVQAQLRPAPELALELENFAGSGDTRGTNALESTLSFTQVLELGGKRTARVEVAGMASDLAALDQRARELDILAEVTRRFLAAASAVEQLSLAQETERLARETLDRRLAPRRGGAFAAGRREPRPNRRHAREPRRAAGSERVAHSTLRTGGKLGRSRTAIQHVAR